MANTPSQCVSESFHGLDTQRLVTAFGDELRVARQGAHVLSWVTQGRERLFLSERNAFDGHTPIRGGVPVCFPQFNRRGNLPKHGFARQVPWRLGSVRMQAQEAVLELALSDSDTTRQWWAQAFQARLQVRLRPAQLCITLQVHNTDQQPLSFTGALHTYLAVHELAQTHLSGLGGQPEWDAVADVHGRGADVLQFQTEFDRVYQAGSAPMVLREPQQALEITQSPSWTNTVVWNPGADLCARLADMPPQGDQHMLCVEAAQVDAPVVVAPGAQWEGWQNLRVLN